MPVIRKRPRAADDLVEIWDYIAEDNVARADAFIDDVNAKFHLFTIERRVATMRRRPIRGRPGIMTISIGAVLRSP